MKYIYLKIEIIMPSGASYKKNLHMKISKIMVPYMSGNFQGIFITRISLVNPPFLKYTSQY